MKPALKAIDRGLYRSISIIVASILISMVLLAFLQVVLRNFFATGITWADVILRHLVIWICMLGGVLATHQSRHISIDLLPRLVGKKGKKIVAVINSLFVAVISLLLAKAAWVFVSAEMEYATRLFGDFPAWIMQIIIPFGFILIAFQLLLNIFLGLTGEKELSSAEQDVSLREQEMAEIREQMEIDADGEEEQ